MAHLKGNDLLALGYPATKVLGIALSIANASKQENAEVLADLVFVLRSPSDYVGHETYGPLAEALMPKVDLTKKKLNADGVPFKVYGEEMIEKGAMEQMRIAARLPVARGAALMSDAHTGFGVPIGGVLAVENAVIPYAVGSDIGCRMCLSIYELPDNYIDRHISPLKQALLDHTKFGPLEVHERPSDHEIFERPEFKEVKTIKHLKDKAWKQLGTSGSGNHFSDIGSIEISEFDETLGLPAGQYFGIMTHSGSRAFGATLAKHYIDVAMKACVLPKEAKHLAWLDLNTEAGQEYWLAMTMAGDYASACHHDIHKRLAKALGIKPVTMVENHHNYAWKETHNGQELVVHRKGATPAGNGVLGIIPGSMASSAFIVKGKGNPESLSSASHGAGRNFSRTEAKKRITNRMVKDFLSERKVVLMGGDIDEAPMAYKDIHAVMSNQKDLVDILGTFQPRLVRMADSKADE